eukprot:symbB.v1.2.008372.t1/scaffold521.1/size192847/4
MFPLFLTRFFPIPSIFAKQVQVNLDQLCLSPSFWKGSRGEIAEQQAAAQTETIRNVSLYSLGLDVGHPISCGPSLSSEGLVGRQARAAAASSSGNSAAKKGITFWCDQPAVNGR